MWIDGVAARIYCPLQRVLGAGEAPVRNTYERPQILEIGSVRDLTHQSFNKIGAAADLLTAVNQLVIGSLTPVN